MLLVLFLLAITVDASWKMHPVPPHDDLPFSFYLALKHDPRSVAALHRRVQAIIDPLSNVKKPMSKREVRNLLAHKEAKQVTSFAKSVCPGAVVKNRGDSVLIHGNVGCVRKMFPDADLGQFVFEETNSIGIALTKSTSRLVVPESIRPHVDLVVGLAGPDALHIPRRRRQHANYEKLRQTQNITYQFISIDEINRVYRVNSNKVLNTDLATVGIIEFLGYFPSNGTAYGEGAPSLTDLQTFAQESNIPFQNVSTIVGPWLPNNPNLDSGESALDVQMISAVASTPFSYISVNVSWVFGMAVELFNLENTPVVNSVSYGTDESQQCSGVGNCTDSPNDVHHYINRCEVELMKLTAIGVAVVVSSGDQGAPGRTNSDCHLDNTTDPINPSYPGASAWVTSVSGTTLQTVNPTPTTLPPPPPICSGAYPCAQQGNVEVPCSADNTYYNWTTGGGFSQNIPMPLWQKEFVEEYLDDRSVQFPPPFAFNPANRAYPEISAFGSRILIVSNGNVSVTAGTSASAPIVAGLFTLLNDARISAKKSPIPFWNPVLYLAKERCPECFNVISSGSNHCGQDACCAYGFQVGTSRYNSVTGLGTLRVDSMLKFVLALP